MPFPIEKVKAKIDIETKQVKASILGLGTAHAQYRDGLGCTLTHNAKLSPVKSPPTLHGTDFWEDTLPAYDFYVENPPKTVSITAISAAAAKHFDDPIADTRSLFVSVDSSAVFEKFADGFDRDTPMLSWSMGKSVVATLIGIAAKQEILDIDDPIPVKAWRDIDGKNTITWDDLLKMESGLDFVEDYADPNSNVNQMLFNSASTGSVTIDVDAAHNPGDVFYYSSGTTNLLALILDQELKKQGSNIYVFANTHLFNPLGAKSFVLEPDASGSPIGSSFVYATTRDWARLGQLYLNDGLWMGERILPEGWNTYVSSPTKASDGIYGAQFWLNAGPDDHYMTVQGLPRDSYRMSGHEGQYVFIIPDKNMIIVRTGMSRNTKAMDHMQELLATIYDAVDEK